MKYNYDVFHNHNEWVFIVVNNEKSLYYQIIEVEHDYFKRMNIENTETFYDQEYLDEHFGITSNGKELTCIKSNFNDIYNKNYVLSGDYYVEINIIPDSCVVNYYCAENVIVLDMFLNLSENSTKIIS